MTGENEENLDFYQRSILTNVLSTLAVVLLVPWTYYVFDRVVAGRLRFEGLDWSRAVWVVPLFYGVLGLGTVLTFPSHPEYAPVFHLAVLPKLALTPFGSTTEDKLRLGATVGAAGVAVVASRWFSSWGDTWKFAGEIGDRFVLPLRETSDDRGDANDSRLVTMDRDRSILVLGETGAGKSETMKLLSYQIRDGPDDAFVIFDFKDEFRRFFDDEETEIVRLSLSESTHYWNVFEEVEDESEFSEIARAFFADSEGSESGDEFFEPVARQVFTAILTYLYREGKRTGETPTNADIVEFLRKDQEEIVAELTQSRHADLSSVRRYLDPDASKQAIGVLSTVERTVNEVFVQDFGRGRRDIDGDGFAIRNYMEDPDGRRLVLDYPIAQGESVAPAFKFFIDWAMRYGLDTPERQSYFLLDEFQRVPPLERVEDLINTGRSLNAQAILGVQSVAQVKDTYGEDTANAVLSGLAQQVLMRVGDQDSIEYVRQQVGQERRSEVSVSFSDDGEREASQMRNETEHPFTESELRQFDTGQAVLTSEDGWVNGWLVMLEEVKSELDRALERAD